MKKSIFYLFTLLTLIACGGDDGGSGGSGSAGTEYLDGEISMSDQTTAILKINASSNCQWVISWNDNAIQSISPTTGRGSRDVTIKLEENPSFKSERTVTLTLANAAGTISRPKVITQPKSTEYIRLTPSSFPTFANTGGYQDVSITSNTSWTVSTSQDWVKTSIDRDGKNGRVRITLEQNTSPNDREVEVVFKGETAEEKLVVKQEGREYITNITALQISDVTKNSATIKFSYDTEETVVSYGVCYAKTNNPELSTALGVVSDTGTAKQGTPTLMLTNLDAKTVYYVRAYLITTLGTHYGESKSFTTSTGMPGGDDNGIPTY